MKNSFYVYIYFDSRKCGKFVYDDLIFDYLPIYVGKGNGNRIDFHEKCVIKNVVINTNKYLFNILNKIISSGNPIIKYKYGENLTEKEAFELEKSFIKKIGRRDLKTGSLVNNTDGGEGVSNSIISKQKISDKAKKRYKNADFVFKFKEACKGRSVSQSTKNKLIWEKNIPMK